MARAVIRGPENPGFVLNFQVRVADWDQGHETHPLPGRALRSNVPRGKASGNTKTPRSKAGHRTALTNRAINAFYPCNADTIHTGQTGLVQAQPMRVQHLWLGVARKSVAPLRGTAIF